MRLVALLLAPLIVGLAACGQQPSSSRLAKADAKYALEVLDRAPLHGFAPGAFHVRELHQAIDRHDPQAGALLRTAIVEYAQAQHGLSIPRKAWPAPWGTRPPPYDAAADMDAALQRKQFRTWLDAQAPRTALYTALQQAYAAALTQANPPPNPAALATLRANLERLRWLPRDEPATRVDVNIASSTLIYVVNGQPRMTMKTASGRPGDETPTLTSKIDNIVLNPPWNVPKEIAEKEIVPKGSDYLASHNFTTKDDGGLMQQPGPDSALGLVKFDFDNPYAVYLHDTPAKAAFDRGGRAVSHGCVRLEHALDLANLLLSTEPGWSAQRINEVLASRETTTVKLSHPVAVRLMYLTAVPGPAGVQFLPDIYGWDAQVLQLLDARSGAGTRT